MNRHTPLCMLHVSFFPATHASSSICVRHLCIWKIHICHKDAKPNDLFSRHAAIPPGFPSLVRKIPRYGSVPNRCLCFCNGEIIKINISFRFIVNFNRQKTHYFTVFRDKNLTFTFCPESVQICVFISFHIVSVLYRPQHFQKQFPYFVFICRNSLPDFILHPVPPRTAIDRDYYTIVFRDGQ